MTRFWKAASLLVVIVGNHLSFAAEDFTGRVVSISDGDTISVMHNGQARKRSGSMGLTLQKKDNPSGIGPSNSHQTWPSGKM